MWLCISLHTCVIKRNFTHKAQEHADCIIMRASGHRYFAPIVVKKISGPGKVHKYKVFLLINVLDGIIRNFNLVAT